jgi:hypothetical protein
MTTQTTTAAPLLRTLSPLLRSLESKLRACLDTERKYQFDLIRKATLEGIVTDLHRKADDLDVDRPLLVIMLMGGTGVGKSTLLNALAGAPIAQASFTRPTTRDPVVYFHQSIKAERLDPALRACRLQHHDRESLFDKVIVDTPDLDSNDLANREKLKNLLPIADIVLYVGSQEKYHDQLGWELFLEHRKRRAFAFVLNKWDRCLQPGAVGLRPDEDLLRDLTKEGFQDPLLFRTSAQQWLEQSNGQPPGNLPEGEQFKSLVNWLEMGLTRLEIEAIKARGVSQLLSQTSDELQNAAPPELDEVAQQTRRVWDKIIEEKAEGDTDILLGTLDPHQAEIELQFSMQGQRRFWGLMRGYLKLFTTAKQASSSLRDRFKIIPKGTKKEDATVSAWDVSSFTKQCLDEAGERFLDQRVKDLTSRLQTSAVDQKFPIQLLTKPCEDAAKMDWRKRYELALTDALREAEQVWTNPKGARRWLQLGLIGLANILPNVVLLAGYLMVFWQYFVNEKTVEFFYVISPLILTLLSLVLMQVLVTLLLPMRWAAIRSEFRRQLERRLEAQLKETYLPIPGDIAIALARERKQIEELRGEVVQVSRWLEERQQAANIKGMYGS